MCWYNFKNTQFHNELEIKKKNSLASIKHIEPFSSHFTITMEDNKENKLEEANSNIAYIYSERLVNELDKVPQIRGRVIFPLFDFF